MPRILLVDDDALLGPPLATRLQRSDSNWRWPTGRAPFGVAAAAVGFDAAILDVMLPEMDGFELCRTIRRDSDLPIIMLTRARYGRWTAWWGWNWRR